MGSRASASYNTGMQRIHLQDDTLDKAVAAAEAVLRSGGVIVYPTDTVYGLGADAKNADAVERIVRIKQRDANKPMLVMVASLDEAAAFAEVTPLARSLAAEFLPGPLSLELAKNDASLLPPIGGLDFVAIRIPDHFFCSALARRYRAPITSTSVNVTGHEQPRTLDAMLEALGPNTELVDLVIEGGTLPASQPSTLVDARGERASILREGAVSRDMLQHYL